MVNIVSSLFSLLFCFNVAAIDGNYHGGLTILDQIVARPHQCPEPNARKFTRGNNRRLKRIWETDRLVTENLLRKSDRQIDELCSDFDGTCFLIIDVYERQGRLLAFRKLRRKGPEGVLTLSQTRMQPPSPLNWENFNSKTWKIRKDTVRLKYARNIIAGAFMSGGLEFNTTKKQDILIIGLGGGVLNNYFTQMANQVMNVTVVDIDPVMLKIAKKWFGYEESSLHRVIVSDGVRYIHDAAKRGEKYDVVIIDVCYNTRVPLMCPILEFLDEGLIASMRAITADTGTTIVNIITTKKDRGEADKVFPPYSRYYPSCYFINYSNHDKMLFCSAKENNSYFSDRDELHSRLIAVDKALGFQLLLKDQCDNYPLD